MKILLLTVSVLAGIVPFAPARAATDCPLANQPYSSRTLLVDLQLDPRARAVLDQVVPDLVSGLTRGYGGGDLPPGFATIITPAFVLSKQQQGERLAAELDRKLAAIALTDAAKEARCARYDQTPPVLPDTIPRPALLIFEKFTGYRDGPAVEAATRALKAMAERRGWTLVFSDNGAVFNARDLARFDAVVWNNVSGDALTLPQRQDFVDYIENGGGYAGIHGAGGDLVYIWDWYVDTLIGARFIGHPASPPFQDGRLVVAQPVNGITRDLPREWTLNEEWYSFTSSPRESGARVLVTLDESSYAPVGFGGADIRMGDHPVAWTRCIADGRSFYTAIGHRPAVYDEPNSLALLENGIAWAAGLGDSRCDGGVHVLPTNR